MNKKLFFILLLYIVLCSCSNTKVFMFSTFREPADMGLFFAYSYNGYDWLDLEGPWLKPEIGNQKVMRDPSIQQGPDGVFHLVWTSSWNKDRGFGYAKSKDLIHWSEQKFIPVMEYDTSVVNVWAPELFYDDVKKQFLIIWASTIPFKFAKGIEDERNNHRLYYTTTKDFQTFSPAQLYLDPGFSVIDATLVKKDKNDYALVLKDNTRPERNLKVAFSKSPYGPFENISKPFTTQFTEGPTAFKTDNNWLILYDSYRDKKYSASETRNFISFSDVSDNIKYPPGMKHGTVFTAKKSILKKLIQHKKKLIK